MPKTKVRGKRARSRVIIMHAAKGLFEEKGINHVTFNDIADRAEMCRTTIFNHFATINELLLALMEQEIDDILEYCSTSRETGSDLIIEMFEHLIDDIAKYPVLSCKLLSNSIISDEGRPSVRKLEEMIEKHIPSDDPAVREKRVVMITGTFYGLLNHHLINETDFDARKIRRQFIEYVKPYLD